MAKKVKSTDLGGWERQVCFPALCSVTYIESEKAPVDNWKSCVRKQGGPLDPAGVLTCMFSLCWNVSQRVPDGNSGQQLSGLR